MSRSTRLMLIVTATLWGFAPELGTGTSDARAQVVPDGEYLRQVGAQAISRYAGSDKDYRVTNRVQVTKLQKLDPIGGQTGDRFEVMGSAEFRYEPARQATDSVDSKRLECAATVLVTPSGCVGIEVKVGERIAYRDPLYQRVLDRDDLPQRTARALALRAMKAKERSRDHEIPEGDVTLEYLGDGRCLASGTATSKGNQRVRTRGWRVLLRDDGRTIRGGKVEFGKPRDLGPAGEPDIDPMHDAVPGGH